MDADYSSSGAPDVSAPDSSFGSDALSALTGGPLAPAPPPGSASPSSAAPDVPQPAAPDISAITGGAQTGPTYGAAGASAPPQGAGQPSVWKQVVMGALAGLAGSAGSKNFGGGLAGGAAGALAENQRQKDNARADAQQASALQFQSIQAAHMAAETLRTNKEISYMDQDHQDQTFKAGMESAKFLQAMGLNPEFSTDDADDAGGGSAMQALSEAADKHGAVPPYLSIPVGPHAWLHFNMQQGASNGTVQQIINDTNKRFGQPTIQSAVPPKPGSPEEQVLIKVAKDNWDVLHTPSADPNDLQGMKNKLALVQNLPDDTYKKQETVSLLNKNIALSQQRVDEAQKFSDAQAANKAGATKAAETAAETSPQAIAGEAAKAGAIEQAKQSAKVSTPGNMVVGSMPDGSQIAGTADELQRAGAAGITKLDANNAGKTIIARQLISPSGLFNQVSTDIAQLQQKGKIGVVASRWNDFMAGKVGNDPDFQPLRTSMGLLATALMQAHVGARGSADMLHHFESLADYRVSDGPTLLKALETEYNYVHEKAMLPKQPLAAPKGGE